MRGLQVLTIAMAILILAGSAVLIATIVKRASTPENAGAGPPFAATLNEPAGTHIGGIAAVGDRLAIQLQGGGPDRIVLIDPRAGTSVGRIVLAH